MAQQSTPSASGRKGVFSKPYPDFPLTPHRGTGRWCKKVRGKMHYFGKIAGDENEQAALDEWLRVKDDLLAGRKPRKKRDGFAVGQKRPIATFRKSLAWRTLAAKNWMLRNVAKSGGHGTRTRNPLRGTTSPMWRQPPENQGKTAVSESVGALVGAVETKTERADTELQRIIDAWPALPEAIKAGILVMVRAAGGTTGQDR